MTFRTWLRALCSSATPDEAVRTVSQQEHDEAIGAERAREQHRAYLAAQEARASNPNVLGPGGWGQGLNRP